MRYNSDAELFDLKCKAEGQYALKVALAEGESDAAILVAKAEAKSIKLIMEKVKQDGGIESIRAGISQD